jgi:hypothetical protein
VTTIYTTGGDRALPRGALSDTELDAVLLAADGELLRHIRTRGHPDAALMAMMAATVVPGCAPVTSGAPEPPQEAVRSVTITSMRPITGSQHGSLVQARVHYDVALAANATVELAAQPDSATVTGPSAVAAEGYRASAYGVGTARPAGRTKHPTRGHPPRMRLLDRIGATLRVRPGHLAQALGRGRRATVPWAVLLLAGAGGFGVGLGWLRHTWWNTPGYRAAGLGLPAALLVLLPGMFVIKSAPVTGIPLPPITLLAVLAGGFALAQATTAPTRRARPHPGHNGFGLFSHGGHDAAVHLVSHFKYRHPTGIARGLTAIWVRSKDLAVWAHHHCVPPDIGSQTSTFVTPFTSFGGGSAGKPDGARAGSCGFAVGLHSAWPVPARDPGPAAPSNPQPGPEAPDGVTWTANTNWPPGPAGGVRAAPGDIGPGASKVPGGGKADRAPLSTA